MQKSIILIVALLLFANTLLGQSTPLPLHDRYWMTRAVTQYYILMDFGQDSVAFDILDLPTPIPASSIASAVSTMSDKTGNLQYYYNGFGFYNSSNEAIAGGGDIAAVLDSSVWAPCAICVRQSYFSLPMPGNDSVYAFFYLQFVSTAMWNEEYFNDGCTNYGVTLPTSLRLAQIDMSTASGNVVFKDSILVVDTLLFNRTMAVKHANGRDWWIFVQELSDDVAFYRFLLTDEGVKPMGKLDLDDSINLGGGQSVFTPDGSKLVCSGVYTWDCGTHLDILDFDRCEGTFSNHAHYFVAGNTVGGISISPNSRFLYLSHNRRIFQYDLEAGDLEASKKTIFVWNGATDNDDVDAPLYGQLNLKQQIIYSGWEFHFNVIERPNMPGIQSHAVSKGLVTPIKASGSNITYYPYYRLGPIDGSSCDTLGIDNLPIARFGAYAEDDLKVRFDNLSLYEPDTYYWDFGDGTSSTQENPIHTYANAGTYTVCLTVSNENGSDTYCDTVEVGVTAVSLVEANSLEVFFEVASGLIWLGSSRPLVGEFVLIDMAGRRVLGQQLSMDGQAWFSISADAVPSGVYAYSLRLESGHQVVGRIVVLR